MKLHMNQCSMKSHVRRFLVAMFGILLLIAIAVFNGGCTKQTQSILDMKPPGTYITGSEQNITAEQWFSSNDRIVATYYFYWYDAHSGYHIYNNDGSDGLTTHPVTLDGYSYKDVEWHKQQILDIVEAGIDIILPVYWGDSRNSPRWAIPGLEKLVEAYIELEKEGVDLPKIGMFYDTSSLSSESELEKGGAKADLTKDVGKAFFYKITRDFYSIIPPRFRARIDEKPIVWLYGASYVSGYNQSAFDYVDKKFQEDFGGKDLYIVKEKSWTNVKTENVYGWGAATGGPNFYGVAAVGPGYDESAVPGRKGRVRDRGDGEFYRDGWTLVLARSNISDINIVVIETWNEFHEGTDIAESREYGRQYIDMTHEFTERFKAGEMPESFPGKEFLNASSVSFSLEDGTNKQGITYAENPDGKVSVTEIAGIACLKPEVTEHAGMYMYFKINELFKIGKENATYKMSIEYYDLAGTGFTLQYDSKAGGQSGMYSQVNTVHATGTNTWKTVEFILKDALFAGRQNAGADFRLQAVSPNLSIRSIRIEVI